MSEYENFIKKKNVKYIKINGKTKPETRNQLVKNFQEDKTI